MYELPEELNASRPLNGSILNAIQELAMQYRWVDSIEYNSTYRDGERRNVLHVRYYPSTSDEELENGLFEFIDRAREIAGIEAFLTVIPSPVERRLGHGDFSK